MLSIATPTYESFGRGVEFLKTQFEKYLEQTFKNFEVVISDHSKNNEIEKFCESYKDRLKITYLRNETHRGNFTQNTNNAIKNCKGDIIKILFQDDFLWDKHSLEKTYNAFGENTNWLVGACEHTNDDGKTFSRLHYPAYNEKIYTGNNTIGNPSVLSVRKRDDMLFFDERMIWTVDVDYYKRLYNKFGSPEVLREISVVIRLWNRQLTHLIPDHIKQREIELSKKKHE